MILIDGVKYELMKPQNEEMLEEMVREHSKVIWGENSVYFDKKRLKTASGITSIPDGYVVVFDPSPRWYIVEVELSTHQLHNHLSPQISKFSSGISNKAYRDEIIDRIYMAIENDNELMTNIKNKVAPSEVYKFLTGVIKVTPTLAIIIDEKTAELDEVLETNPKNFKEVISIEFKTYLREGCDLKVHAHFFEPLYTPQENIIEKPIQKPISGKAEIPPGEHISFTTEYHLDKSNQIAKDIYFEIQSQIKQFKPGLKFNPTKYYISMVDKKSIAYIYLRKKKLNIVVMLPVTLIKQTVKHHTILPRGEGEQKFYGGECASIIIDDTSNLDEIMTVLKLAINNQLE